MIILSSRLLKKLWFETSACTVNASFDMAFKLCSNDCFSFPTVLAANFGCNQFSGVCSQPIEVSVLSNWNLSRLPFLGQVVNLVWKGFNSEHADLFLCPIWTQRPMNSGHKKLSQAMSAAHYSTESGTWNSLEAAAWQQGGWQNFRGLTQQNTASWWDVAIMLVVSLLVWGNFTVQHSRGLYEGFWPLWRPFENVKCLALQLYRSASACWHTTWQQKN